VISGSVFVVPVARAMNVKILISLDLPGQFPSQVNQKLRKNIAINMEANVRWRGAFFYGQIDEERSKNVDFRASSSCRINIKLKPTEANEKIYTIK